MTLIELFADYVRNKKDLKEYVEKRKEIPTRGEFTNEALYIAQDKLDELKSEEPEIYDAMYETLEEYYRQDRGHYVEYPINFIREILMMNQYNMGPKRILKIYKQGLDHHIHDA